VSTYHWLRKLIIPNVEYHQNVYAKALGAAIRPGISWLDLGAGSRVHGGWIGPLSQDLVASARILVGCDPEWRHLQQNSALRYKVSSLGESSPFRPESFDLVSANMVLEHLENPLGVFREIARILRPGGIFVFVTPNRLHPAVALMAGVLAPQRRRQWANWLEPRRQLDHIFVTHYRANSEHSLSNLAHQARVEVVRLETFRSWPMAAGFAPATAIECAFIALCGTRPFRRFGSNLIGVLRKR